MKKLLVCGVFASLFHTTVWAQQSRVAGPVNNLQRVTLHGHLHPNTVTGTDQGRVSPSLEMDNLSVTLMPSAAQQGDLDQLLASQQNPGSSNYHQWLTPEEFADRFGASPSDVQAISAWLQSQGFTVSAVARGRNSIAFSGTAAQVESAFQTEVHNYQVNGEIHYAAAADPTIPTAFSGLITGIRGLHDFKMRAHSRPRGTPKYTASDGEHYITPSDFATIYDVNPLYAAGFSGAGQTLVIAGQTVVNLSDVETYRTTYGLPSNNPTPMLVPTSRSPGVSKNDLPEADLDLELSGAVARNANILFVYATDVMVAVQYAIDQDLAPVVSVSYGSCELETSNSDMTTFRAWAQQGNAQGITWFAASGDSGGADCDDSQNPGYSVDTPGSVPEVTSMGGTQLAEGVGQFWSATNTASGGSALSYIPETTWNTSVQDDEPSASGGGASIFFAKPSWQTGPGVPNDNARDVPDMSLAASPDHDGFLIYTSGSTQIYGGTSCAAPSFAGIVTLLNQYLVSKGAQSSPGVGNINSRIYSLAQTNPAAFHDVTTGNNIVTVTCGTRRGITCTSNAVGFYAGPGFDQATGLGSVDVNAFITGWNGAVSAPPPLSSNVITLLANLKTIAPSEVTYLTASVTSSNGATPTGTVTFEADGTSLGSASLTGVGATATATLAVNGGQLPIGSATLTAVYTGSSSVTASVAVNVTSSGASSSAPEIAAVVNPATYKTNVAPGGILTVFGSQLAPAGSSAVSATSLPLPVSLNGVEVLVNGVAAPLYYASTGLLNAEIPYETNPGAATLSINNNGSVATESFTVSAAAPAIFTTTSGAIVPTATGSRGQVAFLYITGAGAVSPAISTGAAPSSSTALSSLPTPTQQATVTVGGTPATIQFIGITAGLAGVMQINFIVPTSIGTGAQPVVVTVGGVSSPAATLTVVN